MIESLKLFNKNKRSKFLQKHNQIQIIIVVMT